MRGFSKSYALLIGYFLHPTYLKKGLKQFITFQTMLPLLLAHSPAGASIRQVAHYGQVIRFKAFRRYNFNTLTNLAVYGRISPPEYDLSNVKVPTYLHYGENDREVNYKDIYTLAGKLPNTVGLFRVGRDTFNHYDFIWASDAKELLFPKLLACMKNAEEMLWACIILTTI